MKGSTDQSIEQQTDKEERISRVAQQIIEEQTDKLIEMAYNSVFGECPKNKWMKKRKSKISMPLPES